MATARAMRMRRWLIGLVVALWALPCEAWTKTGTTYTTNGSDADVQSAVTNASSGDTVTIPAGDFTWATGVTITGKRLTLQGAGIGVTTVRDNTTAAYIKGLSITASATNFVDVSGVTFILMHADTGGMISITGTARTLAFRFHHNRLEDGGYDGSRGIYVFYVYGLIDNCQFVRANSTGAQFLNTTGDFGGVGNSDWLVPLSLGTANAVYVEYNTFTNGYGDDVIDAEAGSRLVVRFNTFTNTYIGLHGTDSGGSRSPVSFEVYENTFTNNTLVSPLRFASTRGGVFFAFHNTAGGTYGYQGPSVSLYRVFNPSGYVMGMCDGVQRDVQSADPTSSLSLHVTTYNTVARFLTTDPETRCTSGTNCTRPLDGTGTGSYPCRDQPGVGPGQVMVGLYEWNNTNKGSLVHWSVPTVDAYGLPATTWYTPNRDYFNYTESFTGAAGVGIGTLAARPATCTAGVAYWASDAGGNWQTANGTANDGTLYKCGAGNSWTDYYTPYTYPHPLAAAPAAPAALSVTGTTSPMFSWTHGGAGVVWFERSVDGAVTSLGLPTPSGQTYTSAVPSLTNGQHTITIRACNPTGCTPTTTSLTVVKLEE